jgi:hypothetical protein
MDTNATSFSSPLASVKLAAAYVPSHLEYVFQTISNASGWQIFFTVLALCVVYDQGMSATPEAGHGAGELTLFSQSATFRKKVQSLAHHGKCHLSDRSCNP